MDNKKEQERAELFKMLWKTADGFVHSGGVDAWDFKQYVLGFMFYRYISENLAAYIKETEDDDFDYANLTDEEAEICREGVIQEKGFFIYPSQLFCNVHKNAPSDPNLNETLEGIFRSIEESTKGTPSEKNFQGIFASIDISSSKLGETVADKNKKLREILNGISEMGLNYTDNKNDAFGDAYEYLMGMYASNAGKKGGEFYTPQEVSELLTKIGVVGKQSVRKVYDPACGSGSLLLKAAKILGKENVKEGFYGQEINLTTANLCKINMFLHNIESDKFDIGRGDTLTDPKHSNYKPFDLIVSNPPYSIKWEGKQNPLLIDDARYSPAGVLAPPSKADLAFVMHSLDSLSSDGVAAIVCFPGVMYRGGAEQKIREYLIEKNFVDAIIQLPTNLFYGTSIATCILVMKKSKTDNKVLFIDASKEFMKGTNSNKLSDENVDRILKYYTDREDKDHISKLVSKDDIKKKSYNLSVNTYVEQEDTREKIDIKKLNSEIEDIVKREDELREKIRQIIKEIEVQQDE